MMAANVFVERSPGVWVPEAPARQRVGHRYERVPGQLARQCACGLVVPDAVLEAGVDLGECPRARSPHLR